MADDSISKSNNHENPILSDKNSYYDKEIFYVGTHLCEFIEEIAESLAILNKKMESLLVMKKKWEKAAREIIVKAM